MDQAPNDESKAVLKVRLWLSGAPGGFWPEEDEIPALNPSTGATLADSESTAGSSMCGTPWPTDDSGRSSRLSSRENAPQSTETGTASAPAGVAELQHVHDQQMVLEKSLAQPPHGNTPRSNEYHEPGDKSMAASLSQALLKIRIQYASSDEEDDADTAEETYVPQYAARDEESSTSAYSSGGGEEEEGLMEASQTSEPARARDHIPFPRANRRSRAERATRNATWQWAVTEQSPCRTIVPTYDFSSHARAPDYERSSANIVSAGYETPVFFSKPPCAIEMPIVPAEVYALAKNYCENECDESELLLLDYIKTHRALRQGRERAAAYKKRKEEEQFRALKALFRRKRTQDEREGELVHLGAKMPMPPRKPSKPAEKKKGASPFPIANGKRGPRRTLGALKNRLAQSAGVLADPRASSAGQQPPREAISNAPAPGARPLAMLQEELMGHLVLHPTDHPATPADHIEPEAVRAELHHQDAANDVETANAGDPTNTPLTYEQAQQHFAPLIVDVEMGAYVSEQGSEQLEGLVTRAVADSPSMQTLGADDTAGNGLYVGSLQQPWDTSDCLINPFRTLEEIATTRDVSPETSTLTSDGSLRFQSCDNDESWSVLLEDTSQRHPTLKMRIVKKPEVSSTTTSQDDVEDTTTPGADPVIEELYQNNLM
ncbi:hypothetical protein QAD02_021299 [Eretmocerus hayati]|uniref:Uncharacterized protein n=1 Tax=Eretmocerus hayati TaxID=131215 RepID=A0ACC2PPS4_9HYME|nr:hypothetical protein QAD02_021299 [Eretmocerus hayati]